MAEKKKKKSKGNGEDKELKDKMAGGKTGDEVNKDEPISDEEAKKKEEEMLKELQEEIDKLTTKDIISQMMMSLSSLAYKKMGIPAGVNDKYKDKVTEEMYIDMLSKIPKPCVIIHYPEDTIKYVIPAMKEQPTKVMAWCYNSHLPRSYRLISFFGIKPDLSRYKIPYRNPNDKRVKELIAKGSKGTAIKEWFLVEQVKNVSKEYQGYANQIPEKVIDIILTVCGNDYDIVFDPFMGSGTTLKVAKDKGFDIMGCDIDPKAVEISKKRIQ